jgi:hypothetical protein
MFLSRDNRIHKGQTTFSGSLSCDIRRPDLKKFILSDISKRAPVTMLSWDRVLFGLEDVHFIRYAKYIDIDTSTSTGYGYG